MVQCLDQIDGYEKCFCSNFEKVFFNGISCFVHDFIARTFLAFDSLYNFPSSNNHRLNSELNVYTKQTTK